MAIRIIRLGDPRAKGEGPRLGTARRLPRGVRKSEYARRNYFDIWFPELAPSQKLLSFANAKPLTGPRWASFSVGCYCEREDRCHRSVLRELLAKHGARILPVKKP